MKHHVTVGAFKKTFGHLGTPVAQQHAAACDDVNRRECVTAKDQEIRIASFRHTPLPIELEDGGGVGRDQPEQPVEPPAA
jgi:hypothetical protein